MLGYTMTNLGYYKTPIVEGINDVPLPPNFDGNRLGCNGAYFISKYHGLIDGLDILFDGIGTAAYEDAGYFATSAQGLLAETVLQPVDISNFETTAQLNSRDIANRDRSNHTGYQSISTVSGLQNALDLKAPLESPALTGIPTAPTATASTNTTQVATTAFVRQELNAVKVTIPVGGFIESPTVEKSYPIFRAPKGYVIKSLYLLASEGSGVLSLRINGTPVGSNYNVSATESVTDITVNNNVGTAQKVSLYVVSITDLKDLEFTLTLEEA